MNYVNQYLLLPLQRKVFHNFGHYDYQTATFHLHEERVNELFFDPSYHPFIDVLRDTSRASPSAAPSRAGPPPLDSAHSPEASTVPCETGDGTHTLGTFPASSAAAAAHPPPPQSDGDGARRHHQPLRLLRGRVRSSGLMSFFRQMTTQKSWSVESVDLVFDVADPLETLAGDGGQSSSPNCSGTAEVLAHARGGGAHGSGPATVLTAVQSAANSTTSLSLHASSTAQPSRQAAAGITHSYSIEDHASLQDSDNDMTGVDAAAAMVGADSWQRGATKNSLRLEEKASELGCEHDTATQFHTVGDLMAYLRQQLRGVTVGVAELRITFCVAPAGHSSAVLRTTEADPRSPSPPKSLSASTANEYPRLRKGACVLHVSCCRGLRFALDASPDAATTSSAPTAVEDMQCSATIQDWQCYLLRMEEEGPMPTKFSLNDLIFSMVTGEEDAKVAPLTVQMARRGAPAPDVEGASGSASSSLSTPRMLVDVESTGVWSAVLSAMHLTHLCDVVRRFMGDSGEPNESSPPTGRLGSLSHTTWTSPTVETLQKQVREAAVESGEAVAAAALAATQLRSATKYVSVHCGGCSVTLLTQTIPEEGVIANAWRQSLTARQLALLDHDTGRSLPPRSTSPLPVYEALASPHLTYSMRHVDILFPNIEAGAPSSSTLPSSYVSGIFQKSAKKRKIYRKIFENNLADPAVTSQLARMHASTSRSSSGGHCTGGSIFLGIGSISLLEYRCAASSSVGKAASTANAPFPQPTATTSEAFWRSLRPAKLMLAERRPYAIVVFHRFSPPLPEQTTGLVATERSLREAFPPRMIIHQETLVVGVATITVQLDVDLLDVLTAYGDTVAKQLSNLICHQGGVNVEPLQGFPSRAHHTRFHSCSPQTLSTHPVTLTRTHSSVKVLLESVDASVRFPLQRSATNGHANAFMDSAAATAAGTTAAEPQSALLERLLCRLRETSVHAHRCNRAEICRRAMDDDGATNATRTVRGMPERENTISSLLAQQEELGFPEDTFTQARFLPEFLCFSLRDLQVVHTPSSTTTTVATAARRASSPVPSAAALCIPAMTSVKWREAVVYVQDMLERTKSELFRIDYSRDMSISATHTGLSKASRGTCKAMGHVLELQVRLGEIRSTVLTQDDYLLAMHYFNELMSTLTRCRHRLHTVEAAAKTHERENAHSRQDFILPASERKGAAAGVATDTALSHKNSALLSNSLNTRSASDQHMEPSEKPLGSVAEAFAISDAQKAARGGTTRPLLGKSSAHTVMGASSERDTSHGSAEQSNRGADNCIPELWRLVESTCTSLDVQVSRIRMGFFAPRLSPMGQAIGEPLYRCLPKAQRRLLTDLNCLYHLYIVELLNVSIRGLSGDGTLAAAGKENYVHVRLGGLSLWERHPAALPAKPPEPCTPNESATTGTPLMFSRSASVSLRPSRPSDAPPIPEAGARRDLEYYMSITSTSHAHNPQLGSLTQLIQSYTNWSAKNEGRGGGAAGRDKADSTDRSRASQVLSEVWEAYRKELQASPAGKGAPDGAASSDFSFGEADDGAVCGVCLLQSLRASHVTASLSHEWRAPASASATPPASQASLAPNTRVLRLHLEGLGLHHAVGYNGDHFAAVLKHYFTGGDVSVSSLQLPTASSAELGVHRGHLSRPLGTEPFQSVDQEVKGAPPSKTEVQVHIANLMATYRPRGAGRPLAVLLLPRASVQMQLPVSEPSSFGAGKEKLTLAESRRSGAALHSMSSSSAAVAMLARAWLHTPLSLYICNDCDVEALQREILDPAESGDWGMDLESAGFVRLCDVGSTQAATRMPSPQRSELHGRRSSTNVSADSSLQEPNLRLTVWSLSSKVPTSLPANDAAHAQDRDIEDEANDSPTKPNVSIQLQQLELSAFMAKDAFAVFHELTELWSSGADLLATDTPVGLVMRSGPGFEWVAEEVARSCAPMTFRINPYLTIRSAAEKVDAVSGKPQCDVEQLYHTPGIHAYASQDCLFSSTPLLQPVSRASEAPRRTTDAFQRNATAAASAPTSDFSAAALHPALCGSSAIHDYRDWRDALQASYGRDPQLNKMYQARVAQVLDAAPWVPARPSNCATSALPSDGPDSFVHAPPAQQDQMHHIEPRLSDGHVWSDALNSGGPCSEESPSLDVPMTESAQEARQPSHTSRPSHQCTPVMVRLLAPSVVAAQAAAPSSLSSSFSDLGDVQIAKVPLRWYVPQTADSHLPSQFSSAHAAHGSKGATPPCRRDADTEFTGDIDLLTACESYPHFLSCWSRQRVEVTGQNRALSLNQLDRTDDALLHSTTEKYLYPPVELEFFLRECSLNICLYEGVDLMPAAVRKQRRGYLQIVSRGAQVAQAMPRAVGCDADTAGVKVTLGSCAPPRSGTAEAAYGPADKATTAEWEEYPFRQFPDPRGRQSPLSSSRLGNSEQQNAGCAASAGGESSASRLRRLHERGCRSGFGDRDASKRLVLSCRGIAVQLDTFPQAAEEDLWLHVVVGEVTVFDCIDTSDVYRLLTATPQHPTSYATHATGSAAVYRSGQSGAHHLELTGLFTSSKNVHINTALDSAESSRASFAVSNFQQGGSELALVVRLQPTSLTWSGASVDFAQAFFFSSLTPPSSPHMELGAAAPSTPAAGSGAISGTEAPPLFYRRIVILPTTLTVAGSFQSEKGVLAALSEGNSLDALRSIPILSWISLGEIPLPIPLMRIEDCSSTATLVQRVVEDSNCVSIRFLLTACCCGLQPLSAAAHVGEAAKGLLLLPLSPYRGAALHHAIRTASSVFMQEVLSQTSGIAALLASGSYHASRTLLERLVPPQHCPLAVTELSRAAQPVGVVDGWRQGQEQLRVGLQEALSMASYCTGPDGSLLRVPAAALRLLMGVSGAATTTLWGVRNTQNSTARERDGHIFKKAA